MVSKKRKRIFAALALLIGLSLALLVAEAGLRVHVARRGWTPNCYATGLVFFVPDDQSGHTLRPSLRLKSSAYDISVNSMGMRGPEISADKPSDAIRIAVLGGSSVFGYLVPEEQDSCRELETLLAEQGIRAEVVNAGVPGFNMTQCRHRFFKQVVPLKPDYVITYLGWNDSPFLLRDEVAPQQRTPPAPPLMQRALSHSVAYGFLRFRVFPESTPQFAPPPDADIRITETGQAGFREQFNLLIDSITDAGAIPLVSTQIMASRADCEGLDQFMGSNEDQIRTNRELGQWITQTVRSIANERQVELIDCDRDVACNESILGDAVHLTRQGHIEVAKCWANAQAFKTLAAQ